MKMSAENGATFQAYVSMQGAEPKPGLIICCEAFGVNSHMRLLADQFATHGYVVVVPDLLWRIEPGMEITYNEAGLKRASEIAEIFDKNRGADDVPAYNGSAASKRRLQWQNRSVGLLHWRRCCLLGRCSI